MESKPLNVPETGAVVIIARLVAEALAQPPLPNTVYVMVADPAVTGVISPVEELIFAMDVSLDIQIPPEMVEEKSAIVLLEHIPESPLSVPATGGRVIVKIFV